MLLIVEVIISIQRQPHLNPTQKILTKNNKTKSNSDKFYNILYKTHIENIRKDVCAFGKKIFLVCFRKKLDILNDLLKYLYILY